MAGCVCNQGIRPECIVGVEEKVRVGLRVQPHIIGQWTHAPVGELVRLVHIQLEYALEEVRQGEPLVWQQPHCLARVKHVDNVQAVVALQPDNVAVCAMQYLQTGMEMTHVLRVVHMCACVFVSLSPSFPPFSVMKAVGGGVTRAGSPSQCLGLQNTR